MCSKNLQTSALPVTLIIQKNIMQNIYHECGFAGMGMSLREISMYNQALENHEESEFWKTNVTTFIIPITRLCICVFYYAYII